MPNITNDVTVEAIAQAYTKGPTSGNKTTTLILVGYNEYYANSGQGHKIYENQRLKKRIAQLQAKTAVKISYDHDKALRLLQENYDALEEKALEGNIQAIQARTAIIREFNACTGQHSSTINTGANDRPALSAAEQARYDLLAKNMLKADTA
jgi:hypothetical protein